MYSVEDFVAQWIRRWSTKPETLGSIPSGVVFLSPNPYGCVISVAYLTLDGALVYETRDSGFDPSGVVFLSPNPYGCVIPAYLALDRSL